MVGRQAVITSNFSTVVCAPIYSTHHGLASQVQVGQAEGLKHESSIHCDELVSLPKSALTDFVGTLSAEKLEHLNRALAAALDLSSERS